MTDYLQGAVKSANTFLERWRGAGTLVRESQRFVEVVLSRSPESAADENLCLYVAPLLLDGPRSWDGSALRARVIATTSLPVANSTRYDEVIELADEAAGFRCFTESLEVKENVKLSLD